MISFLKNIIKRALITLDRSTEFGQCEFMETVSKYEAMKPYGFISKATSNSLVLVMNVNGDESNKIGFEYDNKKLLAEIEVGEVGIYHPDKMSFIKFKNNGDIQLTSVNDLTINITQNKSSTIGGNVTNSVSGNSTSTISGNTSLTTTNLNITATTSHTGNVSINGNLSVNGTISATGAISSSTALIAPASTITAMTATSASVGGKDFSTHTHSPGSYTVGPDAVTGTSGVVS